MATSQDKPRTPQTQLTSWIRVPEGILFQDLDGEAVLLNPKSGKYFGLDETGTRMWEFLAEHGQVEAALRALLEVYDVSEERLQDDLRRFVDSLVAQGLLEIEDAEN